MSARDVYPRAVALLVTLRVEPLESDDGAVLEVIDTADHNELSWRVTSAVLEALELGEGSVVVTAQVRRAVQ